MANGGMIRRSASTPALRSAPRDRDSPVVAPLAPLRRRPSAISLEKHGNFIFDEINSLLEDDSGSTGRDNSDDMIDREVRPPATREGISRRMSELSLDSFDCADDNDDDDRDGEDPARHRPQEAPQEQQQELRANVPRSPGWGIVERSHQQHRSQVPVPTALARSASAPVGGSRYCNNNRVSVLTRIEQGVIEKGIRDGKLVRTDSHVSFRSSVRRTLSVSVIREDRVLSHDRLVQAWVDDDDEEPTITAPNVDTHSYLNDDEEEDDSNALFF